MALHSFIHVTPIRLGLLSRSKISQIVAYKVVSFVRISAQLRFESRPCLFSYKLGLIRPCWTDVVVSGARNYVAIADSL